MNRRKKQNQPFIRRLLGLRVVLVVNAVILILLSLSFGREFVRNYKIQQDVAELKQTAETLETRNLQIAELHTQMQTESFIEQEARLKLGLKKPGERVIVVQEGETTRTVAEDGNEPQKSQSGSVTNGEAEEQEQTISNAKKWWYYFFDQQSFEQITYEGRNQESK